MNFDKYLQSLSVRNQSFAAIFLRAEGARGAKHLPLLLERCMAIDATKDLDRFEEALLGFGAMTMGGIVGEIGFDSADSLHVAILNWIAGSVFCRNLNVAAHSIHGLGNLNSRSPEAIECLRKMVDSARRNDDHEHVTLRATALQILRQLDSAIAAEFVGTPAFEEYARFIERSLATDAPINKEARFELRNEAEWMKEVIARRTKP